MKNSYWGLAWRVMANITGWIAFPVIIGLFFGEWLDKKFNTYPWLTLVTIALCFVISLVGLTTSVLKEFRQVDKESRPSTDTVSPREKDQTKPLH